MTRTVYFILRWNGGDWLMLDNEGDRLLPHAYRTRSEAEEALSLYLTREGEGLAEYLMIWEARGYPKLGLDGEDANE